MSDLYAGRLLEYASVAILVSTTSSQVTCFNHKGWNTFEANVALGFPGDLRDYWDAARILRSLNVHRICLLTNNPEKVKQLRRYEYSD